MAKLFERKSLRRRPYVPPEIRVLRSPEEIRRMSSYLSGYAVGLRMARKVLVP